MPSMAEVNALLCKCLSLRMPRISRNSLCPCGSGLKFKKCCQGRVAWSHQLQGGDQVDPRWLSGRGKNLMFIAAMLDALQLDTHNLNLHRADFKRAFTPEAIRKIYQASVQIWPDFDDLKRILRKEAESTSGLYTGTYRPEVVRRAVTRHTLYCDRILLVDPFTDARRVRDEFNPIVHPEKYRTTALMCANLWLSLAPWIVAGVVRFIRTPGDFDASLEMEGYRLQELREKQFPELVELRRQWAEEAVEADSEMSEYYMLHESDEQLAASWRQHYPSATETDVNQFLEDVRRRRERHPFYNDPFEFQRGKGQVSEFLITTTGTNYEMAKQTALLSGSHLITDLPPRWREIELDRDSAKVDERKWSPFAKAFHNLKIKYLDDVPLEAALVLRKEDRLEQMRGFMNKVWRLSGDDSFAPANVENLASELLERVREAEDEWEKIDRDLLKLLQPVGAVAASFVAAGGAGWVPAAVGAAAVGITGLGIAQHQRASFERRFPAGFFLKLKKAQKGRSAD
jgi:hypothetical protein